MLLRRLVPFGVAVASTSLALAFGGCVGDEASTVTTNPGVDAGGETSSPNDAGGGAEAQTDSASPDAAPGTCRWDTPFGAPTPVSALNTAVADTAARLSTDELSVYFARTLAGNGEMFFASRATRTAPFGTPVALTALNTASSEGFPAISSDGLTLVFNSDPGGNLDLFVSTRANVLGTFGTASPLTTVNGATTDVHPYLALDDSELLFASNRAGTDDLYRSIRTGGGFGVPVPIAELNTANVEFGPVLSADKLTIYFTSNREGATDLFVAHRSTASDGFGTATRVPELNAVGADSIASWLSPDGCRIYLSRNPSTALGDIYLAERTPN